MMDAQQAEALAPKPGLRTAVFALLLIAPSLGGALLLYHEALGLPLFFDDMVHLRWLAWHTLLATTVPHPVGPLR